MEILNKKNDTKNIIKTMESVIESVKKKHKHRKKNHIHHHHNHNHNHHHRHHRHIKNENSNENSEPDIVLISDAIVNNLSIISPNQSLEDSFKTNNEILSKDKNNSKDSIKPRRSNRHERERNDKKSVENKNGSIKDHFITVKTNADNADASSNKTNAFEIMMNARNRSLGSNSPGREPDDSDDGNSDKKNKSLKETLSKRKQTLKEWADKKGGLKRKFEEESRENYIKQEMDKRAKRLKSMLSDKKNSTETLESKCDQKQNKINSSKIRKSKRNEKIEDEDKCVFSSTPEIKKMTRKQTELDKSTEKSTTIDLEFIEQLSSPIKKRDSLLGYFPRIVSPSPTSDQINEILNSTENLELKTKTTEKKSSRKSKITQKETNIDLSGNDNEKQNYKKRGKKRRKDSEKSEQTEQLEVRPVTPINESLTTSNGRPKRSCVGKVRYDYDLDPSPTKLEMKAKKYEHRNSEITTYSKSKKDNSSSINTILVDDDGNDDGIEQTPKKLAPIFLKSLPKPVIDPEILKAKHEFLMSGVPEKMKLEIEKQKQFEQNYDIVAEQFPITAHVHQLESSVDSVYKIIDWNKYGITWKSIENNSPIVKIQKNLLNNINGIKTELPILPPLKILQKIDNKQFLIKHLKGVYDKFPTYRCYNQLREKYRHFSAIDTNLETLQITDSLVVTKILRSSNKCTNMINSNNNCNYDDNDDVIPPSQAPNGELIFTEKYKPMLSDQVLVNFNPVNRLKEFLLSWKNHKNLKTDVDASDFECTNSTNSSENNSGNSNTVVLIGPCSSGKTNAVFAIANELNFNVLEINAGMKRTGKKILQDLQEATQSHQVRKDGGNLLKQSLNGKKRKSQLNDNSPNNSSSSLDNNCNEKLSLILIEDADVIFEQDNGFIDAINQLSSISKRPVVITVNNRNCQYLLKLINQNSIEFSSHNALNISKFLSILSLIENCPIEIDDIISLYLYNKKNLRKTLLEMQFFIQSGGDRKMFNHIKNDDIHESNNNNENNKKVYMNKTLFDFYTINQNLNLRIPLPINYNLLWFNLSDIFNASKNLRFNYGNHNKTSSSSSTTVKEKTKSKNLKDKNIKYTNDSKCLNSLSKFYENISAATHILPEYRTMNGEYQNLNEEISHSLAEMAIDVSLKADRTPYNLFETSKERTNYLTSYISLNNMTRTNRSINLDYESCLRSICRSEKSRLAKERRGTRFYHYLRNICITNLNSFSTNLFEKSCEIFLSDNNFNCNNTISN